MKPISWIIILIVVIAIGLYAVMMNKRQQHTANSVTSQQTTLPIPKTASAGPNGATPATMSTTGNANTSIDSDTKAIDDTMNSLKDSDLSADQLSDQSLQLNN